MGGRNAFRPRLGRVETWEPVDPVDGGEEERVDDSGAAVPAPELPVTWRPRTARIVTYALAGVVVASMVALATVLPPTWTLVDRAGLVAFGLVVAMVLRFLARPHITATGDRLTVVNIVRTRVLFWPEVIDVRMPPGEPWPTLDLADGSSLAAMGIQSNDGELARHHLAQLIAVVRERGEAQEPDAP